MANALTGDFDVVVQMSAARVNRILAVMHQAESFPHSLTLTVADGSKADSPDEPTISHVSPVELNPFAGGPVGTVVATAGAAQQAANVRATSYANLLGVERSIGVVVPTQKLLPTRSGVRAAVEAQVSTPTLTLPADPDGRQIAVHFHVMAHVRLDPDSSYVPEFLHGEVVLTLPVNEIAAQSGSQVTVDFSIVEFDFLGGDASIQYIPAGTVGAHYPVERIAMAIANVFAFGFEPSSRIIQLPSQVKQLALKMLPSAAPPAVALLLTLGDPVLPDSARASVKQVFLTSADDYAIAVGRKFVVSALDEQAIPTAWKDFANSYGTWDEESGSFTINFVLGLAWPFDKASMTYRIWLSNHEVVLESGTIRVTLWVHAERQEEWWSKPLPSGVLDLKITQRFLLLVPAGRVQVDFAGLLELEPTSFLGRDQLLATIQPQRDRLLANARKYVEPLLAQVDFASVLRGLELPSASSSYRAAEIQPDGIVLRGTMSLGRWRGPVTTYESTVIDEQGQPTVLLDAYAAWIPGGGVGSYRWRDATHTKDEAHQFLTKVQPPGLNGAAGWCLEMTGWQTTDDGSTKPLTASVCRVAIPTVGPMQAVGRRLPVLVTAAEGQRAAAAFVDVSAANGSSPRVPTLLHFARPEPQADLRALAQALRAVPDRVPATVVVTSPGAGARLLHDAASHGIPGLAIAEDVEQSWSRAFRTGTPPATFLLSSTGDVCWFSDESPNVEQLIAILRTQEPERRPSRPRPPRLTVREGDEAPDFLFQFSKGRYLPLRRLRGRPVVLAFWTSWAEPSVALLRDLARDPAVAGGHTMVLAVNDGEDPEVARAAFERIRVSHTLVLDRERTVTQSFGIHCWPTTVWLDERGRVVAIEMGRRPEAADPQAGLHA